MAVLLINFFGGWHIIPFELNDLILHSEHPINNWISDMDAASVKFSTCNVNSPPV